MPMALHAAQQKTAARAAAHGNSDGSCRHSPHTTGLPTHTAAPQPPQPPTTPTAASPTSNTCRRLRIAADFAWSRRPPASTRGSAPTPTQQLTHDQLSHTHRRARAAAAADHAPIAASSTSNTRRQLRTAAELADSRRLPRTREAAPTPTHPHPPRQADQGSDGHAPRGPSEDRNTPCPTRVPREHVALPKHAPGRPPRAQPPDADVQRTRVKSDTCGPDLTTARQRKRIRVEYKTTNTAPPTHTPRAHHAAARPRPPMATWTAICK